MNAYFQLIGEGDATTIRLFPATDDGLNLVIGDVIEYLSFNKIDFNLTDLNNAILSLSEVTDLQLNNNPFIPINETLTLSITDDKMTVIGSFSCESDKGQKMTKDEILSDLKYRGVTFGIREDNIDSYLANPQYMTDIVLAQGQDPIQGRDASIEYFFNTDLKARPELNEDGTVDFFNLNIINHVGEGELLARLTKEVQGIPGHDVYGSNIAPRNVLRKTLKFGRNIDLSEDRTEIYSQCNGHVTLVNDTVFVSNVMEVENVDNATGNIEYDGNVQINGNVCSNFSVKAKGNVEVRGVVEGALVEAGGNITIARGMNGMGKGVLKAKGNVVAKFIENSTVETEGYVEAGSIMHSTVIAGTDVHCEGKKAFISGGSVTATYVVETRVLGSEMGTETIVEVGVSAIYKKRFKEVNEQIDETDKMLARAIPIMEAAKAKIEAGIEMSEEQRDNIKGIFDITRIKLKEMDELQKEKAELEEKLSASDNCKVVVTDTVFPGTKIIITDVSKIIREKFMHCQFVKMRGDVKMEGII